MSAPRVHDDDRPVLRTRRYTSLVTLARSGDPEVCDEARLCWPTCITEMLSDLGIPSRGSAFSYPRRGSTTTAPRWNGHIYEIVWARQRSSTLPCAICDDGWRYLPVPAAVAAAAALSERMRGTVVPPWRRPGGKWYEGHDEAA